MVHGSFVLGLKPGEIYSDRPDLFGSIGDVYNVKRNVLARLGRNPPSCAASRSMETPPPNPLPASGEEIFCVVVCALRRKPPQIVTPRSPPGKQGAG